jgi:phage tail protein X
MTISPKIKLKVIPNIPGPAGPQGPPGIPGTGGGGNIAYSFFSMSAVSAVIPAGTTIAAIQRSAPSATTLTLPALAAQNKQPLSIVDWSTALAGDHAISLNTTDGSTIMKQATWSLVSTATQLTSATLWPCPDLNAWIFAP